MNINELHHKLGHLKFRTLHKMVIKGAISGINLDPKLTPEFCTSCVQGKAHQQPFPKESKSIYEEKIVTDLWGPAQVMSLGRHKLCQFYHDIAMGEDKADFLYTKAEALEKYQQYKKNTAKHTYQMSWERLRW